MTAMVTTINTGDGIGRATVSSRVVELAVAAIAPIVAANRREVTALLLAAVLALAIGFGCETLPLQGRAALIVLVLAVVGWAMTDIADTVIGLAAVVVLGVFGIVESKALFGTLGHELIWLLITSLIIAEIVRKSGLADHALGRAMRGATTVRGLFLALTLAISATAFVIPSTSARAAILLPVYLALAERITDPAVRRALALMFPTTILLSAGGSLIGAGAHLIAADFIQRSSGVSVDYIGWAVRAMPFAFGTSVLATLVILQLFVPSEARTARLDFPRPTRATVTRSQWMLAAILVTIVALWMTSTVHGIGIALVGLGGVAAIMLSGLAPVNAKAAFKAVDIDMILFIATTLVLVNALSSHGVDQWMARSMLAILPEAFWSSQLLVAAFLAVVSLLAHLVITSRTARASVLIPTVAMPLAALGHDPVFLIMITVLGTGFCQTLPVSSKPVAIFAAMESPAFSNADLMRLSLHLMPMLLVALVAYGMLVW